MKLSEKDKKLLKILLIVIVACVPFMVFIRPMMNKCEALSVEVSGLKSEEKYLKQLAVAESAYVEETEKAIVQTQKLKDRFPSDLLQEASLLFFHETEKKIPIALYQVTFDENVAAQMTSAATQQAIDDIEAETGDVTEDEVYEETTRTTQISNTMTGISTSTQFSYDAHYEEFKEFLHYIQENNERMVITHLAASYSSDLDLVNGTFTLMQYALKAEDRAPVKYLEPNVMLGSNNVFMQAMGVFEEEEQEEEISDFFLMLSQPDADEDALIWGQTSDASEMTYFSSDKNKLQEVSISFSGENGNYVANYAIGGEEFSEEGVSFEADGQIGLEILSSVRAEDDDVEVNLSIKNETDVIVYLSVLNDDEENPRVNIKEKTGDIFTR